MDDRYLQAAERTSVCPWKGPASYVDLVVDDEIDPAAGWFHPDLKDAASNIAGHTAFGGGVSVEL